MKIISKFLTAEMRVTSVRLERRTVVMEGIVKEFMPMTVEIDASDIRELIRVLAQPLRARLPWRRAGGQSGP